MCLFTEQNTIKEVRILFNLVINYQDIATYFDMSAAVSFYFIWILCGYRWRSLIRILCTAAHERPRCWVHLWMDSFRLLPTDSLFAFIVRKSCTQLPATSGCFCLLAWFAHWSCSSTKVCMQRFEQFYFQISGDTKYFFFLFWGILIDSFYLLWSLLLTSKKYNKNINTGRITSNGMGCIYIEKPRRSSIFLQKW